MFTFLDDKILVLSFMSTHAGQPAFPGGAVDPGDTDRWHTAVREANEELGLDIPEGDYETVAGFVLHLLGHIPRQGKQLRYKDLKLVVTKMRGRKIDEILITKEKRATAES